MKEYSSEYVISFWRWQTLSDKRILIAEISGKRAGDSSKRPTEKFKYDFDKVIISNNSEGYETDWEIVNVPDDYRKWYEENVKLDDKAYLAPMNRSYAIKYAKEKGYDYLIQLDDNILSWRIDYKIDNRKYTTSAKTPNLEDMHNDMFRFMADVLDCTNVGIVGMGLTGKGVPQPNWLSERFIYSAFMMNLSRIPDVYQGDFEDDIEFRLKMKQMNVPMLSICSFKYGKTAQAGTKDLTGNRMAYLEAGVQRGANMSKLYGDIYQRGMSSRGSGMDKKQGKVAFQHKLKPFKVGVKVNNMEFIKQRMSELLVKYATPKKDTLTISIAKPQLRIDVRVLDETIRLELLSDLAVMAVETGCVIGKPRHVEDTEEVYTIISEEAEHINSFRALLERWVLTGGVEVDE